MASIYMADDKAMRAREGIRYDFVAPDGSESRDAAAVIYARNTEFLKGIKSSDDYLDFKLAVEALSCGTNTVILDDRGLPSVMVLVPKMNSADLSNGLKSRTHPGFIVGGREYDTVAVGKYISCEKDGMAYSLPLRDPATNYNFDESEKMCSSKGKGWCITPYSLWGALALWTKKNGTMPEGNTYYGHYGEDEGNHGEAATWGKLDGKDAMAHTLTGSGPLSWYHNHNVNGIADLCGNVFEWCSGFRWCDGELQFIPDADAADHDCDMSYTSSRWKAILADGTFVEPGTNGTMKLDYIDGHWEVSTTITSHSEEKRCGIMRETRAGTGVDEIPQLLIELGIAPERKPTGMPYGNDVFWGPNKAPEQFPCRGGNWYDYVYGCGGVFRTSLYYGRELRGNTIGMRLAYYI